MKRFILVRYIGKVSGLHNYVKTIIKNYEGWTYSEIEARGTK